jgi:hypothetical protein
MQPMRRGVAGKTGEWRGFIDRINALTTCYFVDTKERRPTSVVGRCRAGFVAYYLL